jgi:hypothetical protein
VYLSHTSLPPCRASDCLLPSCVCACWLACCARVALQAPQLRTELSRLQAPAASKGLKEDLINALLLHLVHPHTTAGAAAGAEAVVWTELGLQLLQRLSPAVAQSAAAGPGSSGTLQALTHCQVRTRGVWCVWEGGGHTEGLCRPCSST